jgi:hypothetical protein
MQEAKILVSQEYDTLRSELLEAKRYIFERPLIIAALAAAGVQFLDKPPAVILPSVVALLTTFNFWFTVNRVHSASRIVAYIQLVLEPLGDLKWLGWETSLRKYRKWLNDNPDSPAFVDSKVDQTAVPHALMYYGALYSFHVVLVSSAMVVAVGLFVQHQSPIRIGFFLTTLALTIWSLKFFKDSRPSRLKGLIERNRIIWENVLGEDQIALWRNQR